MARQILTIYENVHLNRGLAQRADELSQKLMLQKLESILQRNPALQHLGEAAAAEHIMQAGEAHMGGGQHHAPGSTRLP
jgi:hypothetical protein